MVKTFDDPDAQARWRAWASFTKLMTYSVAVGAITLLLMAAFLV